MVDIDRTTSSPRGDPNADETRAALARILDSKPFRAAERSKSFLRFVVEETLAGRREHLKGYAIGVAVFGRPPSFDAQSDPLVRVEAGRLRRRLAEYYSDEGAAEPLRIELPRGRYAPSISGPPAEPSEPVAAARPPLSALQRWLFGASIVLLACAVGLTAWRNAEHTSASNAFVRPEAEARNTRSRTGPRLLVMPIANLSGDDTLDAFGQGLTDEIIGALVDFDIFSTASPVTDDLAATKLGELRKQFDVGYVLTGSLRKGEGTLRVALRLVDAVEGTQLWTHAFDEKLDAIDPVQQQKKMGGLLAEILSSPLGPVYAHEISLVATKPAGELDPYECLLRFYDYARSYDPMLHGEAVRCAQRAVLSEPRYSGAWSALAVLYLHEWIFGYDPQPDRGPALERAEDAARHALDIDASGRVSALAVAAIKLALDDRRAFEQIAAQALDVKPLHPAVAAQFGYLYVIAGNRQRGMELLDDARQAMNAPPATVRVAYAFANLEQDNYEQALTAALGIDSPNWFVAPMTMAAAAALAGRQDIARREAARLLQLYPDFGRNGRGQLVKWNLDPELRTKLLDGLRLAGLSIS
jgi:adenylate cyclase